MAFHSTSNRWFIYNSEGELGLAVLHQQNTMNSINTIYGKRKIGKSAKQKIRKSRNRKIHEILKIKKLYGTISLHSFLLILLLSPVIPYGLHL